MVHALLTLVLVLAISHISTHGVAAADSPTALPGAAQEFLDSHNKAREVVGVSPLTWSETLAKEASSTVENQKNKMGCKFANLKGVKYGSNQGSGTGLTPRMAVDNWVKEKDFYNHTDNSCAANRFCGVYKQVVWRKSSELGCALATCGNEGLAICFYNPPGNYEGQSPY